MNALELLEFIKRIDYSDEDLERLSVMTEWKVLKDILAEERKLCR